MEVDVLAGEVWARTVAARWLGRLRAQPALRMCLATGHTPLPVYGEVSAAVRRGAAGFAAAEVFGLDEFGGLPPGHPARCDVTLRKALLDRVDLPPGRWHRLDPDAADLAAECSRFQAITDEKGLDLVLLGLGANGHVGLNEPGSAPDTITRRVELHPTTRRNAARYGADGPLSWGLTLGLASILAAREVWLLVTGAAKAEVLAHVLRGPVTSEVPASYLREHPAARVIADEPAAAGR